MHGNGVNGRYVTRFGFNYVSPFQQLAPAPTVFFEGPCASFSQHTAVTVNRYLPGSAITPHIDSHAFDDTIYILSLLGECDMLLRPPPSTRRYDGYPYDLPWQCEQFDSSDVTVMIPRRSLITMTGEIRKTWMHGTEGSAHPRFSIVYRRLSRLR